MTSLRPSSIMRAQEQTKIEVKHKIPSLSAGTEGEQKEERQLAFFSPSLPLSLSLGRRVRSERATRSTFTVKATSSIAERKRTNEQAAAKAAPSSIELTLRQRISKSRRIPLTAASVIWNDRCWRRLGMEIRFAFGDISEMRCNSANEREPSRRRSEEGEFRRS